MNTIFFKYLAALLLLCSVALTTTAQVYVRVRPPAPVIVRPPQPSHVHVWIGHEWEPADKTYRYSGGHWEKVPHEGAWYHHGHWKHSPQGYIWIHGEWKKRK